MLPSLSRSLCLLASRVKRVLVFSGPRIKSTLEGRTRLEGLQNSNSFNLGGLLKQSESVRTSTLFNNCSVNGLLLGLCNVVKPGSKSLCFRLKEI